MATDRFLNLMELKNLENKSLYPDRNEKGKPLDKGPFLDIVSFFSKVERLENTSADILSQFSWLLAFKNNILIAILFWNLCSSIFFLQRGLSILQLIFKFIFVAKFYTFTAAVPLIRSIFFINSIISVLLNHKRRV